MASPVSGFTLYDESENIDEKIKSARCVNGDLYDHSTEYS